jgi:hypothetical protein
MIIKFTLFTLIIVLVATITMSYYFNKEGFEDISLNKELENAISTVTPTLPVPELPVTTDTATTATSSFPTKNEVVPEVSISGNAYDAMTLQQRSELLKDIQTVVRNEIIANRNTTPIIPLQPQKSDTDSTSQGKEYENSCYKDTEYRCPKNPDGSCPPLPDMSQYIKKDSIPCWGCSLDY